MPDRYCYVSLHINALPSSWCLCVCLPSNQGKEAREEEVILIRIPILFHFLNVIFRSSVTVSLSVLSLQFNSLIREQRELRLVNVWFGVGEVKWCGCRV